MASAVVVAAFGLLPSMLVIAPASGVSTDPDEVISQSPLARPAVGRFARDPDFGTRIKRLSGSGSRGRFETPIYSQLQAFSTDRAFVLLAGSDGYLVRTRRGGRKLPLTTASWNAPRWDPSKRHAVLHFDSNEDSTVRAQRTNVRTARTRTLFTFPAKYRTVLNNQSFDEVSRSGRWMSGMVTRADGQSTIFVLNLVKRRLTVRTTVHSLYQGPCAPDPDWGEVEPDWVGVSPLGRYLVIQWQRDGTERCSGLETFKLKGGSFVGRVYDGHQHGDLGVTRSGKREFFMTFELYHPSGQMSLGVRKLPGRSTVSPPRYLTLIPWGNGGHISCQGPNGRCLVSAGGDESDGWGPFEQELFIQRLNGAVRRVAHHRSSSCGYFAQPRATWSRNGRLAIFASDWGTGSGDCDGSERSDPYLLRLR
ncbi:MAG: hypothetical protein U0990_10660 [Candidatus Nanopelagicales bacterium]|nr:hypothetical protein [Candidatus Nanopelagicales bacterium]MDZ4250530.1 hypothetical protein [Candidatus Nanopelagicales bacterium]